MKLYKFLGTCVHMDVKHVKVCYMVYWKESCFRESMLVCAKCYDQSYRKRKALVGAVKLAQIFNRLIVRIITNKMAI
jgi:hypothetical protein